MQAALGALLDGKDPVLRRNAILFVHWKPDEAVARLGPLLAADPDRLVRRNVALVLLSPQLLLKALDDPDEAVHCAAVDNLLGLSPTMTMVLRALRDPSPRIQFRAMVALREMVVETLRIEVPGLDDESPEFPLPGNADNRRYALNRLKEETSPAVRGLLAMALGEKGHDDFAAVTPLLLTALRQETGNPLPGRRSLQDRMLGEFGRLGPATAPAVEELLRQVAEVDGRFIENQESEPLPAQRAKVVFSALIGIGRGAVPQLTAALKSENRTLRTTAAMVLAHVDPTGDAAIPVLVEALDSPSWYVYPDDPWLAAVREEIERLTNIQEQTMLRADVWSLVKIGPRAVPPLLDKALHTEPGDGIANPCLEAIGLIPQGGREAAPQLVRLLKDKDQPLRAHAAWILGSLGIADALPALGEAAGDPAASVRKAAQQARNAILSRIERESDPFGK